MPKTPQKSHYQSKIPFTKTPTKKGQQTPVKTFQRKTSTLKKVQNNKTIQKEDSKDKFSNNNKSLFENKIESSNSSDSEDEDEDEDESDEQEFRKDENISMQDVKSSTTSEEEDSTDSSEDEESEEENLNEIEKGTTKISLKKKQKEKEKEDIKQNQDKTTSEKKDPIPTPLLARPQAEKNFRDFYMNQITKAFGEDLDKLRKKEDLNSNKLEILIDTLESGISIFSDVEKELTLLSSNKK